jgi:hypothetical protein
MNSRTSQRTVYLVTAAIVASMVGGFALANITLSGGTNTSYQGSQTTTISPVSGLTWLSTNLSVVPTATTFSGPCLSLKSPCDVDLTGYILCLGGFPTSASCNAGDFVEQVNLSISNVVHFPASAYGPTPTGAVALSIYVTGTPIGQSSGTFAGLTTYFVESVLPATPEVLTLDFDIGVIPTGPGAVTAISVIATA